MICVGGTASYRLYMGTTEWPRCSCESHGKGSVGVLQLPAPDHCMAMAEATLTMADR